MASSLFGNNQQGQMQPNNMMAMMHQFAAFKQQMSGKDPKAIVQGMLQSGQMNQQQYEQLCSMAKTLQGILK